MTISRRRFLTGAAGLSAAGVMGRDILGHVLPIASAQSAPAFRNIADFEAGTIGLLNRSGNAPTATTDAARAGRWAMRSFLDQKNSPTSLRTEVAVPGTHKIGEEYWVGISIMVSKDWTPCRTREALFQVHDTPQDWNRARNAIAFLETMEMDKGGVWRYSHMWNPVYEGDKTTHQVAVRQELGAVVPGEWVDWVFNWRWDWRESGTGLIRVWKQGKQVINYSGPSCYNDKEGPYLKFGLYKWDWKDRSFPDTVTTRLVYHDEFREAGADGSYQLVAPRSGVQPNPPSLEVA